MVKNILLLALSTFTYSKDLQEYLLSENTYSFADTCNNFIEIKGTYQLEPIPKLLGQKGIIFDHVIMLATSQTKMKKKISVDGTLYPNEISALEFFEQALKNDGVLKDAEAAETFIPIDLNEASPSGAIADTVRILRKQSEESFINLYVDSHGGFRGTQMVLEAILSLLPKEKMQTKVYGIQFGAESKKNQIIEDETVRIFDFVSGINEFLNFGRTDSLTRYLKGEENTKLVQAIQEISEGIQWCNMDSFELGLSHMRNYYKKAEKIPSRNPYLQMFEERIRLDYGRLLENEKPDPVDIVKWCMAKGFYQQALTIIESRMVETYLRKGLLRITKEGMEFQSIKENRPYSSEEKVSDTDLLNGCFQSYVPAIAWWKGKDIGFNVIFSDRTNAEFSGIQQMKKLEDRMEMFFFRNAPRQYRTVEHTPDYQALLNTAKTCRITTYQKDNVVRTNAIEFGKETSSLMPEDLKRFAMILFMHKTLKNIRNKSNHALGGSPYNQNAVKQAIMFYIWLIDESNKSGK